MIRFHYSLAPNPMKVALFLEEAGLAYEPIPVDTRKGEQFAPGYTVLNPNNKVPCIEDGDTVVFDSNAILLYLAEKTGRFLPASPGARGETLSWLMFVATGIGPYCGQAAHFRHFAPEPKAYAVDRYMFEAKRHWGILEARLAGRRHVLGDEYTIVDMAVWGWARMVPFLLGSGLADQSVWTGLAQPEAPAGRDQRPAGGRAGGSDQGPARLQDGDGRGRAPPHVPPYGRRRIAPAGVRPVKGFPQEAGHSRRPRSTAGWSPWNGRAGPPCPSRPGAPRARPSPTGGSGARGCG